MTWIPLLATIKQHIISLIFDYNIKRAYKRKIWDYKNADFDKLNLLIAESNWSFLISEANNVSEAAENFTAHFLSCVRECVPEKNITIRPNDKPWFDSVLRKTIRIRDRLRNIAIKSKKRQRLDKIQKGSE